MQVLILVFTVILSLAAALGDCGRGIESVLSPDFQAPLIPPTPVPVRGARAAGSRGPWRRYSGASPRASRAIRWDSYRSGKSRTVRYSSRAELLPPGAVQDLAQLVVTENHVALDGVTARL